MQILYSKLMATAREGLQLRLVTPRHREQLLHYIEQGQIGYDATLQGPYGTRKGVCTSVHKNPSQIHLLLAAIL